MIPVYLTEEPKHVKDEVKIEEDEAPVKKENRSSIDGADRMKDEERNEVCLT